MVDGRFLGGIRRRYYYRSPLALYTMYEMRNTIMNFATPIDSRFNPSSTWAASFTWAYLVKYLSV